MPSLLKSPTTESLEITDFSGPNLISDEEDITAPQGILSANTEFITGQVRTRRGFGVAFNPAAGVASIYNWLQSQYNRLLYFISSTGTLISRDLIASTEVTVLAGITTAQGLTYAQDGFRIFWSYFMPDPLQSTSPIAATQARVWNGQFTSAIPDVDTLFQSPLTFPGDFTVAFAEPLAGSVTAGLHNFGVIATTRNGYQTAPTLIGSFTSAGAKNLQITLTPVGSWPPWAVQLDLIATPVTNPNAWFIIPGDSGGSEGIASAIPATFTIDFDDVTLQTFDEIIPGTSNDYFALANPGPPHVLLGYGARMVYLIQAPDPQFTGSSSTAIAISEPAKPQWITLAQHVLNLPEFRQGVTAAILADVLYVFGPSWTYAFTDNGLFPIQWAAPRLVSGTVGSPFVHGVLPNPGLGYMWVAALDGLYWLGGPSFPEVPASYYQTPDWHRINFTAGVNLSALEILEYTQYRLIVVKAPLDGAPLATHFLVWDYTAGFAPDTLKYCGPWSIGLFSPGGIGMVRNPSSHELEFWAASADSGGAGSSGKVLRQRISPFDGESIDPALYDDDSLGILSFYRFGPLPSVPDVVLDHIGGSFRARGAGQANLTAYSLDETKPVTMTPLPLADDPGRRIFRGVVKQSECATVQIDNGGEPNQFFILSAVKWFWRQIAFRT